MEPWPTVAWVLLLTLIAEWLKTAQSRDFTVKDIVFLHPSTPPYPGGFKCFTCKDAADNYECNRWSPDIYCAQEARYCYTRHKLDIRGDSVSVSKRCVALKDCLSAGCTEVNNNGHQVCTSCCEGNICNMQLPRNKTNAIFSTTSPLSSTTHQLTNNWRLTGAVSTIIISVIISTHL